MSHTHLTSSTLIGLKFVAKIQENYESDRDWGTGFELLKMMRHNNIVNAVCIATRLCNPGYSHIGKNDLHTLMMLVFKHSNH